MTQNVEQLRLLEDAVDAGEKAKRSLIKAASTAGIVIDFVELRQLDRDIKTCQAEIERSKCKPS